MKRNVLKTLLLVLLLQPFASTVAAGTPDGTAQPLFLTIVIDSSPTSAQTWQQLKASACQAIDSLHQNDRVEILRARDGEPALHSDSIIQSPSISGRQNLRQCIRDIRQLFFLAKADVAKAVAAAFEHLGKHSGEYHCAVLVVSAGNLTDDQVRQIRRLASAYKIRGWSLAFLVQQGASRGIFLAASQSELDVMFLDKGNLPQWLEKARNQGPATSESKLESVRLGSVDQSKSIDPKPTLPPIQPGPLSLPVSPSPAPREPEQPRSMGECDRGDTRYILPVYPVPPGRLPFPIPPDVKPPSPTPTPLKAKKPSWLWSVVKSRYTPFVAFGGGILALIVLVVLVAKLRRSGDGLPDLDEYGMAGTPQKLMCSTADQQYDLGEEDSINSLIIGKGPASAVSLPDDEELEDEHVKITRRRRGWRIKNLAEQPIVVDGTAVKKGRKLDLLLPATIELTQQSRITLSRAPVSALEHEMQTTGEAHETDDV
jgi:hypothetical protein